jgi:two-component system sensor histidine kinase ChvG
MKLVRFFSRIVWRLLAFNLLLVIVPVSAVFYLDVYEKQLLKAQENDMVQQGRILAASLADQGFLNEETAQNLLKRLQGRMKSRLRIVDRAGDLLADSSALFLKKESGTPEGEDYTESEDNTQGEPGWIYDLFLLPIRLFRELYGPPKPDLESADYYTYGKPLLGPEIQAALEGKYGATTRYAIGGQQSIILYSAIPIRSFKTVVGVVLVSQSTYRILLDLYEVRLGIIRIFIYSILAAVLLSIILSRTIGRPLHKLKLEAEAVLDRRGRLTRHFRQTRRRDEIGDLSRSLTTLTQRLEQHIRFIESFAADISHEFKNPLASIRSATDIALEADNKEERIKFLRMIQKDVARMERLLSGAREITKIDASMAQESNEPVELNTLCRHVVEAFRLRHKDIVFSLDIPPGPVTVPGSPERLVQVIENIMDNAISFSPTGGTVDLALFQCDGSAIVRIGDNGPGVPIEHHRKIFERFFSFRQKHRGENNHTGLGLSIVKVIVERYEGRIAVQNKPEGGACFEITLPVHNG